MRRRDGGSITPLVVGLTLVAGLVVTAVIAASAAFLAQRDLAGICDGAAVAAAAAGTEPDADGDPGLDPGRIPAELERYRSDEPGLFLDAATDGRTVTVTCSRRAEIPFGAVLGAPHGLDRTVVARARPISR